MHTRLRCPATTCQRAGATWLPATGTISELFLFLGGFCFWVFPTSLMTENSQRCCNHSLSFHQPCIRSLTAIMIVLANSHPADYWWEAGGLFKGSAITAATEWVWLPCVRTTSG